VKLMLGNNTGEMIAPNDSTLGPLWNSPMASSLQGTAAPAANWEAWGFGLSDFFPFIYGNKLVVAVAVAVAVAVVAVAVAWLW